jgi:hypothetical protein
MLFHTEPTRTGIWLMDTARTRHPSYLCSLSHFASKARNRNLTVPPHRTLGMSQSFEVCFGLVP